MALVVGESGCEGTLARLHTASKSEGRRSEPRKSETKEIAFPFFFLKFLVTGLLQDNLFKLASKSFKVVYHTVLESTLKNGEVLYISSISSTCLKVSVVKEEMVNTYYISDLLIIYEGSRYRKQK